MIADELPTLFGVVLIHDLSTATSCLETLYELSSDYLSTVFGLCNEVVTDFD